MTNEACFICQKHQGEIAVPGDLFTKTISFVSVTASSQRMKIQRIWASFLWSQNGMLPAGPN